LNLPPNTTAEGVLVGEVVAAFVGASDGKSDGESEGTSEGLVVGTGSVDENETSIVVSTPLFEIPETSNWIKSIEIDKSSV